MGLDTDDGRGERVILGERGSYVKPLLTPRGDRVVFSTRPGPTGPEIFIAEWNGSGRRRLAKGFALAVWQNPTDRREWLYIGADNDAGKYDFRTVSRFPIDGPEARELVWSKTLVSADTFQVSGDACDCEGNFNCFLDQDVDGSDAATLKSHFGRSTFQRPCIAEDPCNGDFNCDGDVDGTDASLFKSDFGRSTIQNPCPACEAGEWCGY